MNDPLATSRVHARTPNPFRPVATSSTVERPASASEWSAGIDALFAQFLKERIYLKRSPSRRVCGTSPLGRHSKPRKVPTGNATPKS
jgi:hypothetical protein